MGAARHRLVGLVERPLPPRRRPRGGDEHADDEGLRRPRRRDGLGVRARRRGVVPPGWAGAGRARPGERHHGAYPRAGPGGADRVRPRARRRRAAVAALGRRPGSDGGGLPALPGLGRGRRQDRLHGPRRPGDGELLPPRGRARRRARAGGGLPRRLQAHRPQPHLPQPPHARGRPRQRVQQVEPPRHARAQRHPPLHARPPRRDGLHPRRSASRTSPRATRPLS